MPKDNNIDKIHVRKEDVSNEVQRLQHHVQTLTDQWNIERNELHRTKQLKEQIEIAKRDLEVARRNGNYNKTGKLLHSTIPKLEYELQHNDQTEIQQQKQQKQHDDNTIENANQEKKKNSKQKMNANKSNNKMLQTFVTEDAIAYIISRHTGIPISRITGNELETYKLLNMEQILQKRVIGQDHILQSLSNCIRLARTKLHDMNHTLGNFLLLGPTVRTWKEEEELFLNHILDVCFT